VLFHAEAQSRRGFLICADDLFEFHSSGAFEEDGSAMELLGEKPSACFVTVVAGDNRVASDMMKLRAHCYYMIELAV
jgi:hypothetical protein